MDDLSLPQMHQNAGKIQRLQLLAVVENDDEGIVFGAEIFCPLNLNQQPRSDRSANPYRKGADTAGRLPISRSPNIAKGNGPFRNRSGGIRRICACLAECHGSCRRTCFPPVSELIFAVKIAILVEYFQSLFSHCHIADFSNLKELGLLGFFRLLFLSEYFEIPIALEDGLPRRGFSASPNEVNNQRFVVGSEIGTIRFRATQISEVTKQ